MADLDALKQKYTPVIQTIQKFVPYGATLEAVDLAGEQLHIRGTVPSTVVANRVWDAIKKSTPPTPTSSMRSAPAAAQPSPSPSSPATHSPPSACSSTATPTSTPRSPRPTTSPTPTASPSAPRCSSPSSTSSTCYTSPASHPSHDLRRGGRLRHVWSSGVTAA